MEPESLLPSRNTTEPWIYARGTGDGCHEDGQTYVGKWLVFVAPADVDRLWAAIQGATEVDRLGIAAKVSTRHQTGHQSDHHVICVYTRDSRDKDDVGRVLGGLREIGVEGRLFYKTDQATLSGVYPTDGPSTGKKGRESLYSSDEFAGS
jgi:hypothetical protein